MDALNEFERFTQLAELDIFINPADYKPERLKDLYYMWGCKLEELVHAQIVWSAPRIRYTTDPRYRLAKTNRRAATIQKLRRLTQFDRFINLSFRDVVSYGSTEELAGVIARTIINPVTTKPASAWREEQQVRVLVRELTARDHKLRIRVAGIVVRFECPQFEPEQSVVV